MAIYNLSWPKKVVISERRWYVAKEIYSLIGIYHIPEPCWLGLAGGQGREAPAPPASLSLSLESGLDSHEQNAAIGLVTSATVSI